MKKPDDIVTQSLDNIDSILVSSPVNLTTLKSEIVRLFEYLCSPSGRTDRNCRVVDLHFCLDEMYSKAGLPIEFNELFDDISGALHDTVSYPDIAQMCDSTPEQLLARAKELHTE